MIGVGFKELARTPVPKLPPSYPPSSNPQFVNGLNLESRKMRIFFFLMDPSECLGILGCIILKFMENSVAYLHTEEHPIVIEKPDLPQCTEEYRQASSP